MFPIHSQPIFENKNENIIIENKIQNNQIKRKKFIKSGDYLKLKEAYLSNQEIYLKMKEDNDKLNSLLTSYKQEISKFNEYKYNINKAFEIIQNKYNELYNENKSLKINNNENTKKFNDIIDELNNEIKQYQLELTEKNNELKELKKINNELKTKNEESLIQIKNNFKEKEDNLNNKKLNIQNRENNLNEKEKYLNNKELNIQKRENNLNEKETSLKLEMNELKKEKKNNEELYKKLKEEINLKEKQINLENNKINENKLLINETIEKLKSKEMNLNNEFYKIQEYTKNIIQINEINIEYKIIQKRKIKYLINYKDKFGIIQTKDKNIFFNDNKNSKLNLINNVLLDNYLNTVNIGYKNSNEIIKESLEENDSLDNECEPIPSFLLCLKKVKK